MVFRIGAWAGRGLARMNFGMDWLERAKELWRPRQRPRCALALAGGGVIGGMYEVGAITALEERMNSHGRFDIYIGCSAGAVVASLLANGVAASELFRVIDHDLDDPLNFRDRKSTRLNSSHQIISYAV